MYDLKNVVYEDADFWVLLEGNEYWIFEKSATCSTRRGRVGVSLGLDEAIKVIDVLYRKK